LNADGSIELSYIELNAPDGFIGVTNGYGLGDYPDPIDLIP
jgi:hypothetical protein